MENRERINEVIGNIRDITGMSEVNEIQHVRESEPEGYEGSTGQHYKIFHITDIDTYIKVIYHITSYNEVELNGVQIVEPKNESVTTYK